MHIPAVRIRWPRSADQAKRHAVVLAVMMWAFAAVIGFMGYGDREIAGPLKGADFVHFYTLGHLASAHQTGPLFDAVALHEEQVRLVPESKSKLYPSVYPPQAAALFALFSGWSYRGALLIWIVLSTTLYGLIVWTTCRRFSWRASDRQLIVAASLAFPPYWSLVLHGQVTMIIVLAFWAGWLALERQHRYFAGVAFGLLALKPQFGIPLAVIVLACREWKLLAGAIVSVAAQATAVWLTLGSSVFSGFATTLPLTFAHADMYESTPFMSHSLRAATRLLPNVIGLPLWVALAAATLWWAVRMWRSDAPLHVRLGVVVLASVLVNPHVIIYDVTVLVLPLLWFAAYMLEPERRATYAARFGKTVYWLFATLFMPTAAAIGLQVSVPLMVYLIVFMNRAVFGPASESFVKLHVATAERAT